MIELRPATRDDASRMAQIQVAAVQEQADEYYSEEQVERLAPSNHGPENIDSAVFDLENRYAIIAECHGDVAGFAVLHLDEGYLPALFVDPEYTGQRIGTKLIANIERRAQEAGIESIETYAALNAVDFYLSCGFNEKEQINAGESDIPAVRMNKTV